MSVAPKITVGVAGGISAYKAVELVRALQNAGFDPHVAMTASAEQFVTPLTFAAISGHTVITSLWTGSRGPTGPDVPEGTSSVEHIEEAQTTAALVLAPATANLIAKLAHGLADDFLTTMYLATPAPVILAPAMNVVMWQHPAVQANLALLRARGNIVVEPGSGHLACGMQGTGRLAELDRIVAAVQAAIYPDPTRAQQDLAGETILITAGGTRELIDGVRFLGNRSSGRMGYALAEEALSRGARVILVAASVALPTPPGAGLILVPVTTTAEMRAAVLAALPRATMVLKVAAVADFRPVAVAEGKLTRECGGLTLQLEPTEDIVAEVVRERRPGTLVLAFAAEIPGDGDVLVRAREKMRRKGVDAMFVNNVAIPGIGFDAGQNAGTLLLRNQAAPDQPETVIPLPQTTKRQMATQILNHLSRTAVAERA